MENIEKEMRRGKSSAFAFLKVTLTQIVNNKLVLSLSSTYKSNLMWSHYADEHKGICIGFNEKQAAEKEYEIDWVPRPVDYERESRELRFEKLYEWVKGGSRNDQAYDELKKELYNACYLAKEKYWSYEEEYRIVANYSVPNTCSIKANITELVFGMRCDSSIIEMVKNHVKGRGIQLKRLVQPQSDGFELDDIFVE